mgnify:FL=1
MDLLTFLMLGIGFGFLHALEPDHLTGVATIASSTRSKLMAFQRGVVWGIGHTLVILILYIVMQGLRLRVNETEFIKLEILVGVMLILLGLRIWYKLLKGKYHFHPHKHEDEIGHLHFHSHKLNESHEHIHIPFGIGVIHGLAGSGAVILALTLQIKNQLMGALYIILFGAGSCIAMGMFSGFIVSSIDIMGTRVKNFDKVVTIAVTIIATVSCLLGYRIIRNSNLF